MIDFIDQQDDWNHAMNGSYIEYVKELKAEGKIRHIGMSTHNPLMVKKYYDLAVMQEGVPWDIAREGLPCVEGAVSARIGQNREGNQ